MPLSTRLAQKYQSCYALFNDYIMFFKSLEGKANMVSDASSSFLDYLVYNQGCIKFDIYFSSLAEISLMFHWVILSMQEDFSLRCKRFQKHSQIHSMMKENE